jgi:hypothetical protein
MTPDPTRRTDAPVIVSLVRSGRSALKMLVEIWYIVRHEGPR